MNKQRKGLGKRIIAYTLAVILAANTIDLSVLAATQNAADLTITATNAGENLVCNTDYTYDADTGVLTVLSDKAVTIANANEVDTTNNTIVVAKDINANITLAGVNIDVSETGDADEFIAGKSAFTIEDDSEGNVTITLADGTTNTLKSGFRCAGLQKNGAYISEDKGKLTIQGGTLGTGTLTATGGEHGAGIGSGYQGAGTNITISGGTVEATSSSTGAGIGGGFYGAGTNITISGGTVTATSSYSGAGIGGGSDGAGTDITISGGSVKASGGTFTYSGNTYTAAAIGQGVQYDGASYSDGAPLIPTNGTDDVYLLEFDVDGTNAVTINSNTYPSNHNGENKLYVYLPAKTLADSNKVAIGNTETKYYYDTENSKWMTVVDIPAEDTATYTYDGTQKTYGIVSNDYYTVTGGQQTEAGTYTVTVALKGSNMVWSDGTTDAKTYTFKINQADEEITDTVPDAPAVGTKATSDDGKATYKVTTSDLTNGTVAYVAPTNKKATKVTIPDTVVIDGVTYKVTAIEKNAFKNNKKLKTLKLGKNITTIGDKAFYKCTALTKVTISDKVKTIGKQAFYGCKKLTTVTIGKNVSKIGSKAFYGCKKLKTLTIKSKKLTTKKIGSKAFSKTPKSMTVKVPKKKLKSYKSMLIKRGVNKKAKFKKF